MIARTTEQSESLLLGSNPRYGSLHFSCLRRCNRRICNFHRNVAVGQDTWEIARFPILHQKSLLRHFRTQVCSQHCKSSALTFRLCFSKGLCLPCATIPKAKAPPPPTDKLASPLFKRSWNPSIFTSTIVNARRLSRPWASCVTWRRLAFVGGLLVFEIDMPNLGKSGPSLITEHARNVAAHQSDRYLTYIKNILTTPGGGWSFNQNGDI